MPETSGAPPEVTVRVVGPEAADEVYAVVHAAFAARPPLDPPADALAETPATMADALATGGGMVAESDGRVVGALVLDPVDDLLWVRRFGVLPTWQEHGVGARMAAAVVAHAGDRPVAVLARPELPRSLAFWEHHGFVEVDRPAPYVQLVRPGTPPVPTTVAVPDATAMRALGSGLARRLRAGDLLVLTGGLGAGKTTFTQGLGEGLGVRGGITSPTFVIARVHPSLAGGPALVHVDAYRLGGVAELDDLDLDTSLDEAVTVVEWGAGVVEQLAESHLEVVIERAVADDAAVEGAEGADGVEGADERVVRLVGHGPRWA
ncbi:tRNA (adenosine(37)-N6)-threonylcarbamoyltransferase complex ATPase subunit type 1 TsaE [Nocardioides zeae]|uniref:tRNA threonylcarbamoyladenosine biosynthesis protein TsaE n=1 Tax=Nocardioides imazamoxiresistens TaxID=3231893 RepID=A0ABU3PR82_9ACTN|nr:tRNA (adenosine(37)-N6)-threonylcarbamoyltransferase complex ATPase subunit type 1 TsaE [Nocardioides zeae]MDT9591738.1 tRNA (adenosine(37)-N6)-threonylcarbamoyltransferase complex ATPase subunit type 1 TsaE [Nocardioides zeae]